MKKNCQINLRLFPFPFRSTADRERKTWETNNRRNSLKITVFVSNLRYNRNVNFLIHLDESFNLSLPFEHPFYLSKSWNLHDAIFKIWLSIDKLATSWRKKNCGEKPEESLKPVFKQHDQPTHLSKLLRNPNSFFPSAYFIFFPTAVIPRWLVTLLSFFTGPGFAKLSYKFAIFGRLLNRQPVIISQQSFLIVMYLSRNNIYIHT